jgi:hypothetical protein
MMYKAKFAVCSEIRKKHLTQSEHHVEIWMLNLVVRRETVRLLKVNITPRTVPNTLVHAWRLTGAAVFT